jgi:HEAT repeat protein
LRRIEIENMDLDALANIIETMVLQQDYPGFEVRSLKLGLPEKVLKAPKKIFAQALDHNNIHVKLAALRWFQERPGAAKSYTKSIAGLLGDNDEWVRLEAIRTLESLSTATNELAMKVIPLLRDQNVEVRKSAAKALGKISSKARPENDTVIDSLKAAACDRDAGVRFKAQKALRRLGYYTT